MSSHASPESSAESSREPAAPDSPWAENSPTTAVPFPPAWKSARGVAIAALVIALIALGVGIAAWFRAAPGQSFSDDQKNQAKTTVCAAYNRVRTGQHIQTTLHPAANDALGWLGAQVNARLSLLGGGAYLQDVVAAQPAAPADIAQAVNSMADTSEQLGAAYLANAKDTDVKPLLDDLNSKMSQLNTLCEPQK